MPKENALTIAGSDPSGGAGVQADIKSFQYLGVHGFSVITCVTAQNTQTVKQIYPLSSSIIEDQLDSIFDDSDIKWVKTGMLYNGSIADLVAKKLNEYGLEPVVDPVLSSTTQIPLSTKSLIASLKTNLLPISLIVTPNIDEASILSGITIKSIADMENASRIIHTLGSKFVVVKGGHLPGKTSVDVIFDGKKITKIMSPYISKLKVHGSGCAFSSLLTGYIALGIKPLAAIKKAKQDLWNLYSTPYHLGKKASFLKYPPELDLSIVHSTEHITNAIDLLDNIKKIVKILPLHFVPEVGINICYALPNAQSTTDICGIDGRISAVQQGIRKCGKLSYGGSYHIAKIILTAMKHNPLYRAAMNIAYTTDIIKSCQEKGFLITSFSRCQEPKNPHSSMEWGTNHAIQKLGEIPDIIYDTGGQGKEAMIRILGEKPKDLLKKVQKITI